MNIGLMIFNHLIFNGKEIQGLCVGYTYSKSHILKLASVKKFQETWK